MTLLLDSRGVPIRRTIGFISEYAAESQETPQVELIAFKEIDLEDEDEPEE